MDGSSTPTLPSRIDQVPRERPNWSVMHGSMQTLAEMQQRARFLLYELEQPVTIASENYQAHHREARASIREMIRCLQSLIVHRRRFHLKTHVFIKAIKSLEVQQQLLQREIKQMRQRESRKLRTNAIERRFNRQWLKDRARRYRTRRILRDITDETGPWEPLAFLP